jgi:hemoglobin
MERSVYERYGGFAQVSRIVLDFYDRIMEDDDLGPFFDEVDMARIVDHQTKFIAMLLGGPAHYTDDQIARVHSHLVIGETQFDRLSALLAATLAEHGFAAEDVACVVAEFDRRRGLVVKP